MKAAFPLLHKEDARESIAADPKAANRFEDPCGRVEFRIGLMGR